MRCEKFSQKLQIENDNINQDKVSFDDESDYYSQNSDKIQEKKIQIIQIK